MITDLPQNPLWGIVPGLITACFGAYKDTLVEPFETKKFFRSIIITFIIYAILEQKFPKEKVIFKIALASMIERCFVEGYKAIIGKPPGKFICPDGVEVEHSKDRGWLWRKLGME